MSITTTLRGLINLKKLQKNHGFHMEVLLKRFLPVELLLNLLILLLLLLK